MEYINKYFEQRSSIYKIVRVTAKTLFFKQCQIEISQSFNDGRLHNSRFVKYAHYSSDVCDDSDGKMLKTKLQGRLYDNVDDLYFVDGRLETNYRQSLLCRGPKRMETLYRLQYALYTFDYVNDRPNDDRIKEYKSISKNTINNIINIIPNVVAQYKAFFKDNNIDTILLIVNPVQVIRKLTKVLNKECPICLDVKDDIHQGHFKCCHHICDTCFDLLPNKICCLCRSE